MKLLLIAAVALVCLSQLASAACHNATGSCTHSHFMCANEEVVSHSKRCDGVEDCADGTDEYMCEHPSTPISELKPAERTAMTEVGCVKCTCLKGTITIPSTNAPWFTIAKYAPRDLTMMTDAPTIQNKPCHLTQTSTIILNVYKKQNKGCRGFVCCFRQKQCSVCTASYNPNYHCWI